MDYPNVSFPAGYPASTLARRGIYTAESVPRPSPDHVRDGFELISDLWHEKWREMTQQEKDDRDADRRARTRVEAHQLRIAIIEEGHGAAVQAAIDGLTAGQKAKVQARIDSQPRIPRNAAWINLLLDAAGLDIAQKDALFAAALAIED